MEEREKIESEEKEEDKEEELSNSEIHENKGEIESGPGNEINGEEEIEEKEEKSNEGKIVGILEEDEDQINDDSTKMESPLGS